MDKRNYRLDHQSPLNRDELPHRIARKKKKLSLRQLQQKLDHKQKELRKYDPDGIHVPGVPSGNKWHDMLVDDVLKEIKTLEAEIAALKHQETK